MSVQGKIAEGGQIAEQTAPGVSGRSLLPWELVKASDHHGPYICDAGGADVCDLYAMSNYLAASIRNGGSSYPIPFRNADANAAFIVRAANSHDALVKALEDVRALIDVPGQPLWSDCRAAVDILNAALASAREVQS